MAHNIEINETTGTASIAYAGKTPWHGLGTQLPDAFTAEEALRHAGLDFAVAKEGLYLSGGVEIPGRSAIVRTDTRAVLGICSSDYSPLQNREAFSFFDSAIGEGVRYETAGVLGKGERIWLMARLPGEFRVAGDDTFLPYLLLSNSHDGSETVRAKCTAVRVVCQNTLSAALPRHATGAGEIRVRHLGDVASKVAMAGTLLRTAGIYFDELTTQFQAFRKVQLSSLVAHQYFLDTLTEGRTSDDTSELHPITRRRVEAVEHLYDTGLGTDLPGVRGSLWGAYNAVTEWVDHTRTSQRKDLRYLVGGAGEIIKEKAFATALQYATANN